MKVTITLNNGKSVKSLYSSIEQVDQFHNFYELCTLKLDGKIKDYYIPEKYLPF